MIHFMCRPRPCGRLSQRTPLRKDGCGLAPTHRAIPLGPAVALPKRHHTWQAIRPCTPQDRAAAAPDWMELSLMSQRIEDCALTGDIHTAALISTTGSPGWAFFPFDSSAAFLEGETHGSWQLGGGAQ